MTLCCSTLQTVDTSNYIRIRDPQTDMTPTRISDIPGLQQDTEVLGMNKSPIIGHAQTAQDYILIHSTIFGSPHTSCIVHIAQFDLYTGLHNYSSDAAHIKLHYNCEWAATRYTTLWRREWSLLMLTGQSIMKSSSASSLKWTCHNQLTFFQRNKATINEKLAAKHRKFNMSKNASQWVSFILSRIIALSHWNVLSLAALCRNPLHI